MLKLDAIEDGRKRARLSITAAPGESDTSVLRRGFAELLEACPNDYQPLRLRVRFERDTRGRESSRRLFLTMIYQLKRLKS